MPINFFAGAQKMKTHVAAVRIPALALAAVMGLSACSLPNAPATKAAAQMSRPFSDGEIIHVLHTVNNAEISQARVALERSNNPRVQETARLIIQDHSTSNQRIGSIAQTTGIRMEESVLSKGLQMQANRIVEGMAGLSGTEFDCNFFRKQAEQHALTLDTVRNQLLPAAGSAEVRTLLTAAAPKLEQHLKMAQAGSAGMPQCPRG
jgi:putative membrane protein